MDAVDREDVNTRSPTDARNMYQELQLVNRGSTTQRDDGSPGNYHSAILLISLLGSLGVALAVILVLISSAKDPRKISKNARNVTQPIHTLFTVMLSLICLYFVLKKNAWKASNRVTFVERHSLNSSATSRGNLLRSVTNISDQELERQPENIHHKMSTFEIVTFSAGAILWLVFEITSSLFSTEMEDLGDWISIVDSFIYIPSIVIQLVFLLKYDGAILPNHWFFHYSIALMVVDKIWVWLQVTLDGLADFSLRSDGALIPFCPSTSSTLQLSKNESSASAFERGMEACLVFLETFFMEFLTISMGVLIHLWNFTRKPREREPIDDNNNYHPGDDENQEGLVNDRYEDYSYVINSDEYHDYDLTVTLRSSLLGSEENNHVDQRRCREKTHLFSFTFISIVIALGILAADLILYVDFFQIEMSISESTKKSIYRTLQCSVYVPMLACLVAIYRIYRTHKWQSSAFNSSGYLLLFGNTMSFIWFILRLTASVTVLSDEDDADGEAFRILFYSIGCLLENWGQTQFLLAAQNVHQMGKQNSKLTRFCLIYTGMINVSQWIQLAFYRKVWKMSPAAANPMMTVCFGPVTTSVIVFFFYPLLELYRFHSTVMAYEILK